jgi:hypothetical protein
MSTESLFSRTILRMVGVARILLGLYSGNFMIPRSPLTIINPGHDKPAGRYAQNINITPGKPVTVADCFRGSRFSRNFRSLKMVFVVTFNVLFPIGVENTFENTLLRSWHGTY